MSAASNSQRGTGPWFVHIENLPKRYTWQDLKDLIRRVARHGIFTQMDLWPNGTPSGTGHARVQRQDEAYKLYRWLTENVVENRSLRVHLWDISISDAAAVFVQCNCGSSPQSHPPSLQIAQFAWRPGWQTFNPMMPSPAAMPPPALMPVPQPPAPPPTQQSSQQQQLMAAMASMNLNPQDPSHCAHFQQMYYARQAQTAAQMQQRQHARQYPLYTTNSTGAPINTVNGLVRVEAKGIFISGLNFKARTKDVETYFGKVGELVKCDIQKDPQTGKSKGNATIKYASAEAAQRAIQTFHGRPFMQMTLNVRLDRDQTPITPPPNAGTGQPARSSNQPIIVNGSAQVRQEA